MSCCLLHQKLQMLNCCILHKIEHQRKHSDPATLTPPVSQPSSFPQNVDHSNSAADEKCELLQSNCAHAQLTSEDETTSKGNCKDDKTTSKADDEDGIEHTTDDARRISLSESSDEEFFEAQEHPEVDESITETESLSNQSEHSSEIGEGKGQEMEGSSFETTNDENKSDESELIVVTNTADQKQDFAMSDSTTTIMVSGDMEESALGRLRPCGDLVLVATGKPMYIPITQVK